MQALLPLLRCPQCSNPLEQNASGLRCNCNEQFNVNENGILLLLRDTPMRAHESVRRTSQKFYEEITFPGYEMIDSPAVLMEKAARSGFGKWVDQAISPFATVLEVGCGTGQMTNFLGLTSTRTVVGVDQSVASLTLGKQFRDRFDLRNVHFLQGNIFALPIKEESVDVLICSGVLHHTPDPCGGFQALLRAVKPGGGIIIGLYNRYARIPLGVRKWIFRLTGNRLRALDHHMRRSDVDQSKKEIWFADQYRNPHESWHSVDEVLQWFDQSGVAFVSAVPEIGGKREDETDGLFLFEEHRRGSKVEHLLRQLGWMFTIGREGGLFVMVGGKR